MHLIDWLSVAPSSQHHCEEVQQNGKHMPFERELLHCGRFFFMHFKAKSEKKKKLLSHLWIFFAYFSVIFFPGRHKLSRMCSSSSMLYVWSIFSYEPLCAFYFFPSSNEKNKSLFCYVCTSFRFLTSHLLYIIHQTFCVKSACSSKQPARIKESTQKLCKTLQTQTHRVKNFDLAIQRLPPGGLPVYRLLQFLLAFFPQGFDLRLDLFSQ